MKTARRACTRLALASVALALLATPSSQARSPGTVDATFDSLAAGLPLHAAAPGKTQRLDSPDQTPQGLEKSDWASIRAAHTA